MSADGVERELKFGLEELSTLREKLGSLEAERVAPSAFEDNVVFDREGELGSKHCLLRLRTDARGARLTYKGPPSYDGGLKSRLEHETVVEDFDSARAILEALGYVAVRRYQKKREEWRLGSVLIALDRTPIGDFAEFEGDAATKVAERCGLDPAAADPRSYLQIYDDHRSSHPEAPADMVFSE